MQGLAAIQYLTLQVLALQLGELLQTAAAAVKDIQLLVALAALVAAAVVLIQLVVQAALGFLGKEIQEAKVYPLQITVLGVAEEREL
jgi:hypothetical protein